MRRDKRNFLLNSFLPFLLGTNLLGRRSLFSRENIVPEHGKKVGKTNK